MLKVQVESFPEGSSKRQKFVDKGVQAVKRMSARTEPLSVRVCCANLIGAIADDNALQSAAVFESDLLPTVTKICQDFNWDVRKEICGQLPFIGKHVGATKAFKTLQPELQELLDDEEKDVIQVAILAFGEFADLYFVQDNDLTPQMKDEARKSFVDTFKQILTQDQFIGKVEICRFLLENAFWIAEKINKADDGELTGLLLALLRAWRPGVDKRFEAEEYERQHIALALQNIVKIYGTKTMLLFYEPLYKEFFMQELVEEKPNEKS